MRSKNSIKNAIIAAIMYIVTILIGFIAQKIFIETLGTEYLGINGLFTNIISMLSIIELGLGSAIIYHLYKPIADNDKAKVKSIMRFYKNGYRIIAIFIGILGLLIVPFLHIIVGEVSITESIALIYILFLIDVIASYLLSYKRSILYANQKTYIVNLIHMGYLLIMNIAQILVLVKTQDYILYLWIKIICRIIENTVITLVANKMYAYITDKNVEKLDAETKKSIFTNIKGLVYHKMAGFIVLGSDNIIISLFLGIRTVGLYSNYYLIIQALNNLFLQVFNSITASVGNLLVENDKNKSYKTYKNMLFLNSWIFAFVATGILCIIEPFITVWIGSQYILPFGVLITLVINFYLQGMRRTISTFKEAAGIFYKDRYMPILESLINIIASIIFVQIYGLAGVFIGTIVSTFVLFFYGYPKYTYKPLFQRTYIQYLKDYLPYIVVAIVSTVITYFVIYNINLENMYLQILVNILIICVIPNLIHLIAFCKSEELKFYKEIIKQFINKKRSKRWTN